MPGASHQPNGYTTLFQVPGCPKISLQVYPRAPPNNRTVRTAFAALWTLRAELIRQVEEVRSHEVEGLVLLLVLSSQSKL